MAASTLPYSRPYHLFIEVLKQFYSKKHIIFHHYILLFSLLFTISYPAVIKLCSFWHRDRNVSDYSTQTRWRNEKKNTIIFAVLKWIFHEKWVKRKLKYSLKSVDICMRCIYNHKLLEVKYHKLRTKVYQSREILQDEQTHKSGILNKHEMVTNCKKYYISSNTLLRQSWKSS